MAETAAITPHCPTCRCELEWRPYSRATLVYRECAGCGAKTERPGVEGWVWRFRAAVTAHRVRGRATGSLCPACRGLQSDFNKP